MSLQNKYLLSAIVITVFMIIAFSSSKSDSENEQNPDSPKEEKPIRILGDSVTYDSITHSYTILCNVKNVSDGLITHAEITSKCYDNEDHVIGTGPGNINNLPAGGETTVEMHIMGIQDPSVTHKIEVSKVVLEVTDQ